MGQWRKGLLCFLGGLAAGGVLWDQMQRPPAATIVLDLTLPDNPKPSGYVDLYVNSLQLQPMRLPARPGRFRYEWPCPVEEITFLRLDPVPGLGLEGTIHSLSFLSEERLAHRFEGAAFASWQIVQPGRVSPEGFIVSAKTQVNFLYTNASIRVPQKGVRAFLARYVPLTWPSRILLLVFLGGLLVFALDSRAFAFLGALAACVYLSINSITKDAPHYLPADQAVGSTTYFLIDKGRDSAVLWMMFVIPSLLGAIVWLARARWQQIIALAEAFWCGPWPIRLAAATGLWVLGCYLLSGAYYFAVQLPAMEISPNWDEGNIQLWSYLANTGALPYRDFWYPYSGHIHASRAFPVGFLYDRFYHLLVFVSTGIGFYLACRRSLFRTVVLWTLWLGLFHLNVFSANRYATIVPLVLCFAAISADRDRPRPGLAQVGLWLGALAGLMGDVVVFFLGWIILVAMIVAEYVWHGAYPLARWPSRLKRDFAVPAALLGIYLFDLTVNGQLPGFLRFLLDLNAMRTYSATPSGVDDWLRLQPIDNGLFFWAGALLIASSGYLYTVRERLPEGSALRSVALLGFGAASILLLGKQLMHQGSAYHLGLAVPLAGFLMLLMTSASSVWAQRLGLVLIGTLAASGLWSNAWFSFRERIGTAESRSRDLRIILSNLGRTSENAAKLRRRERFQSQAVLLTLADAIKPMLRTGRSTDLFTLTDDQLLYVLTEQQPPYYANLYDGSFLRAQRQIVSWLRENQPAVVVVDTRRQDLFGIPTHVRCPLVFEEVVQAYIHNVTVGSHALLKRRPSGAPVDVAFWKSFLGSVALGGLPAVLEPEQGRCSGTGCAEWLAVDFANPPPAGRATVSAAAGDQVFEVTFTTVAKVRRYWIPLHRIWFWPVLKGIGAPRFWTADSGARVASVMERPMGNRLY